MQVFGGIGEGVEKNQVNVEVGQEISFAMSVLLHVRMYTNVCLVYAKIKSEGTGSLGTSHRRL